MTSAGVLLVSSVPPYHQARPVGVSPPEDSLQPHPVLPPLPDRGAAHRPVEPLPADGLVAVGVDPDSVPSHLTSDSLELDLLTPPWRSPVELAVVLLSLLAIVLPVAVVLAVQEAAVVPEQAVAVVLGLAGPAEVVNTAGEVGAIREIVSEHGALWEGQVRQRSDKLLNLTSQREKKRQPAKHFVYTDNINIKNLKLIKCHSL